MNTKRSRIISLVTFAGLSLILPATAFGQLGTAYTVGSGASGGIPVAANGNASLGGANSTQVSSQAQALLAEVQALETQLDNAQGTGVAPATTSAGSGASGDVCPQLGRSLSYGSTGADVTRLQQYLALDPTIYPQGIVSGYFGSLTQTAVQNWQTKFNIVSSGSPSTTGFGVVGPRTAAAIAIVCGGGSYNGITGVSGAGEGTQSGFIQVSPISGAAPLNVSVTATVNTSNSCGGGTYSLSFGDGTPAQPIVLPPGNCSQEAQTDTHTYQYGGTYQVALSAGTHTTTASVTVTGTPAPAPASATNNPNLPPETFTASTLTGSAPLTVMFTGVVNSNDAGFCSGTACSDTIDFGDGSTGNVTLPSSLGSWLDYSVQHTYTTPGGFAATLYQGKELSTQPIVGTVTVVVGSGSSAGYTPPVVTPNGSAGQVSLTFNQLSSCDAYQVNWGDNTTPTTSSTSGTTNCSLASQTQTLSHTYAAAGTYTLTLERGASLSQVDTVAITVAN